MMANLPSKDREERLNEILLEYVEACEAGEEPDRQALLAAHPDMREEIAEFLRGRDELRRLTSHLRRDVKGGETIRAGASDAIHTELGQLGDFRLIREVGRGGMGIVYEAEQISLHRRVALKVLPFASALDPRQLQRFKNEAAAAAHLRHEHIVAVHAVGCERGVHYYAMQFVEGQSLAALIAELRQQQESKADSPRPSETTIAIAKFATERVVGKSRFDWFAEIARQAASALEHAHQTGVIHRDIKPGNLLLDARGQLWITDFGLAQIASDNALTMTGELLGTLRYASPEQTLGRKGVVDHRSDIFSLGATLYELLTLRPPFDGRDRHELLRQITEDAPTAPKSLDSEIPDELNTIVLKTLRKDPADRYATAQELADDLRRFLDRQPIRARPPSYSERFRAWARRHPAGLLTSVVALLLVTFGSILIAFLVGAERERTREAYRAEQARAEEAESRLKLARRAVDELLRISEEELADRPEMLIVRRRILRSALAFYQEFLAERRDNPRAQAELRETTGRVEQILADLEILRSATQFFLLCQEPVLEDLKITAEQRPQINALTASVAQEWIDSLKEIGVASPAERAARTLRRARVNDARLDALLTPEQEHRLRQIGLQSEGAAAFRDSDVAQAIGLSASQRKQIRMIEDEATYGWMRGVVERNTRSSNERIMDVLTQEQVRKWRELTGEPLKEMILPFSPPTSKANQPPMNANERQ